MISMCFRPHQAPLTPLSCTLTPQKVMFYIYRADDTERVKPVGYFARIWAGCIKTVVSRVTTLQYCASPYVCWGTTTCSLIVVIILHSGETPGECACFQPANFGHPPFQPLPFAHTRPTRAQYTDSDNYVMEFPRDATPIQKVKGAVHPPNHTQRGLPPPLEPRVCAAPPTKNANPSPTAATSALSVCSRALHSAPSHPRPYSRRRSCPWWPRASTCCCTSTTTTRRATTRAACWACCCPTRRP